MGLGASIRALQAVDLDAVVELDRAITGRSRRAFFEKRFEAVRESPQSALAFVAEEQAQVLGVLFVEIVDGEFGGTGPVGVLGALGVQPAAQRRALGRRLLSAVAETLAAQGVRALRTEAEWSDAGLTRFFAAQGFTLAPRLVLQRDTTELETFGRSEEGDDVAVARPVIRTMTQADLPQLIRVDLKITGRDRAAYYRRKSDEALRRSGVRVSLVAEVDGQFAGFVMARVDLGDFGRTEPTAVLDTLGVNPAFSGAHVGRALVEQLLVNLRSLRVERAVTQVDWGRFDLLEFLSTMGFRPSQRLALDRLS